VIDPGEEARRVGGRCRSARARTERGAAVARASVVLPGDFADRQPALAQLAHEADSDLQPWRRKMRRVAGRTFSYGHADRRWLDYPASTDEPPSVRPGRAPGAMRGHMSILSKLLQRDDEKNEVSPPEAEPAAAPMDDLPISENTSPIEIVSTGSEAGSRKFSHSFRSTAIGWSLSARRPGR
jgi:hypothetical protein